MSIILANVESLAQYHNLTMNGGFEVRPSRCPHCGKSGLHCHGCYPRKADRENQGIASLNPILIFRFLCVFCKHTCSVLPECIPPRRWYLWAVQEAALLLKNAGHSLRYIASKLPPARSTIQRWENRLEKMFKIHSLHLCSRFPNLGRSLTSFATFWDACLKQQTLAKSMYWIYHAGGVIP